MEIRSAREAAILKPLWNCELILYQLKQIENKWEEWQKKYIKSGVLRHSNPGCRFPNWSEAQREAYRKRPDMLLIRMNLAGIKAALAMLKRERGAGRFEDSFDNGYPLGFNAESWGRAILSDFGLAWFSNARKREVLSRERSRLVEILSEWRRRVDRDVILAHNRYERAMRSGKTDDINQTAWDLWYELGASNFFPAKLPELPQADKPASYK